MCQGDTGYSVGEKIRKHRKEMGFTLEELAKKSGSVKSYIWEIEKNNSFRPCAAKLNAIANVLNITVEYLLNEKIKDFLAEETDKVFFTKYQKSTPLVKKQLSEILDVIRSQSI